MNPLVRFSIWSLMCVAWIAIGVPTVSEQMRRFILVVAALGCVAALVAFAKLCRLSLSEYTAISGRKTVFDVALLGALGLLMLEGLMVLGAGLWGWLK